MSEYIERGALIEVLGRNSIIDKITYADGKTIREKIVDFPAADVVELPCIRPFNNGVHGMVYEVLSWHDRFGFMTKSFLTEEEAEEELRVVRMGGGADNG